MSEVTTMWKVTLTSHCKCYDCTNPDCYELNISDDYEPECDSCQSPTTPANYCDGFCYESDREFAKGLFDTWLSNNGKPNSIKVSGKNVGWRNLSGYDIVEADFNKLFEYLILNGEWTLDITANDTEFSIRRSSHDEPTGASYIISPLKNLASIMSIDSAVDKGLLDEYSCHPKCGEFFYDCVCEVE